MLRYIKIYSIDISLGAVISAWFLGRVVMIDLPWYIFLVIFASVWIIYTLDHLFDAIKLAGNLVPERYIYHHKYRYPIIGFVVIATIAGLLLSILLLPRELFIKGMGIVGGVIIYFLLRWLMPTVFAGLKELFAALIYTTGIALPAFYYIGSGSFFLIMVALQFFCIVFANLLICSAWDEELDKAQSHDSMTITFGKDFIHKITLVLIGISMISSAMGFFIYTDHYLKMQLVILIMNLSLLLVYFFEQRLYEHLKRLLVDAIFFIPLLLFLI